MSGQRLLIVGPAWVGDMVMAQSLFRLLAQRRPGCVIDVLAPAWSEPLLARMPEVRRAIALAPGHGELGLAARRRLGLDLRRAGYAQALVLPRSWKSALVPWFARVPRRTGLDTGWRHGLLNDRRPLNRDPLAPTVQRYLALGLEPGETLPEPPPPQLRVDRDNAARLRQQHALAADAVALMPGAAYGPAKCWPLEYFASLAGELVRAGRQVWILGAEAEQPAGELIRAQAGSGVVNLCGRTALADTVDLLAMAAAAVTNDSGLMHVAAAAGTHVVAIYGSSSPVRTPPLTSRRDIFYLGLDCSPCFRRECPLGHLRCLRDIQPGQVLARLPAA